MQNALIIFKQLIIMFIYIAVGFILFKKKLIDKAGTKSLASIMIYAVIPSVIFKSFLVEKNSENTKTLLFSLLAALVTLLLSMAVSAVIYKKRPVDNIGVAFSNCGFMGIPLITGLLGSEWVFSVASFVALLNIFQWTYGQNVMIKKEDRKPFSFKVLVHPLIIAFVLGIAIYFSGFRFEGVVISCLSGMSALNAPVAMIILGVYLAEGKLTAIFTDWHLYFGSFVRLVVIPLLTFAVLCLFPAGNMRLAILIVASAPIGSNVAVYAGRVGADYPYAARTVCLSTILSVVSMPLIVMLASLVWG